MEFFAAVIYLLSYFCPATKAKAELTESDLERRRTLILIFNSDLLTICCLFVCLDIN